MTKGELTELIQRHLAGGEVPADVRGKYHENVIALYLGLAYNTALWNLTKVSKATRKSSSLDQYIKTFDVDKTDIKCDDKSKEFYIETPADIPQTMGGQAVRYVGSPVKGSRGWLYRNPTAHDVFNELDVNLVDQSPRYSIDGDRIYIFNILDTNLPECVRVKMLTSFEDYDDDDEIPIPGGQDMSLLPPVIQLMQSIGKEELVNDNQIQAEASMRKSR
jgi:hypothetical protein